MSRFAAYVGFACLTCGLGATACDESVTGAGETGGGGSGAGGAGGHGGVEIPCRVALNCPGEETECASRVCNDEVCGMELVEADTPIESQSAGDCRRQACDGEGHVVSLEDPLDPEDDGVECTDDICIEGNPVHRPKPAMTPCGTGEATVCDGEGHCVGCTSDLDCPSDTECADWACAGGACEMTPLQNGAPCGDTLACTGSTMTLADACDGRGSCQDAGTVSCSPYACSDEGPVCRSTCDDATHCCCGFECVVPGLQAFGECAVP